MYINGQPVDTGAINARAVRRRSIDLSTLEALFASSSVWAASVAPVPRARATSQLQIWNA